MTLTLPFVTRIRDYLELTKPKVVILMLITAMVGMFLATPGAVPLSILVYGTIGIGLAAGAAAVLNHVADQKADLLMHRTQKRPLPMQRVSARQALIFAGVLMVLSFGLLHYYVNTLTAVLSFVSLVGYAGVYTGLLKRLTPQNIVIGGLSGATPPLLGWVAVTNEITPQALLLVLIIFTWTPPHFWALAIHRVKDYERARLPMLPVTHGVAFTKRAILLYSVLLFIVTLLPFLVGMSSWVYLVGAVLLGAGFIFLSARLIWNPEARAIQLFHYSNLYLCLLFVLLLVDHYMPY